VHTYISSHVFADTVIEVDRADHTDTAWVTLIGREGHGNLTFHLRDEEAIDHLTEALEALRWLMRSPDGEYETIVINGKKEESDATA
jgi:hypothetical protein